MAKLSAFFLAFLTFFSQLFGLAGSGDYQKQTGLKAAIAALQNKEAILAQKNEGAVSDYAWSPADEFRIEDTVILKKEAGKDFTVLNFSDTHFSDYDYRAWFAFEGEATMRRLVAETNPDLITLSGDLVCGDSTLYSMKRLTDLMESFGVPWAPVYGNHDDEANCDLNYLADIMMQSPHCVMQKGDPAMGVGNYIVSVCEETENGALTLKEALVMMDSHHSQPNDLQQQWFSWAADGINAYSGGAAEISVMLHIPLPDYQTAYDAAWNAEKKCWNEGYNAYGALHEEICCEKDGDGNPVDRGFFDIIKSKGTVKHVLCGHEHMNNFSIEYEGVRLTYMMKLGYGSGFQVGFNGCTVLKVGDKGISRLTHKTVSAGIPLPVVDIKF